MKVILKASLLILVAIALKSCSSENDELPQNKVTVKEVIANYAKLVHQNYLDSYNAAVKMQNTISSFTSNPSQAGFDSSKKEWLAARDIYGQTEVFRGSNGPVDSEGSETWVINNEGQMNAWPLDEGYIDYVTASSDAYAGYTAYSGGVIAGTDAITEAFLIGKNEKENDKSISTGWHAIEFLLWGQDETNPKDLKAGQRSVTDYTTDSKKERRKTYLNVVTSILVKDLKKLVDTWTTGGEYYKVFIALSEKDAIKNIISGPFFLANEELSEERMLKPVDLTDGIDQSGQEDEHSCFSDNTHRDVVTNAQGIINVLFGKYGAISGASVYDLINQQDSAVAKKFKDAADQMMSKIKDIDTKANNKKPFDLLLLEESTSNPGTIVTAGQSLKNLGGNISEVAVKIGAPVQ
ncbi:imelysin family protein [Tenacibaculum halocynthiae]|uniref:imelysin family protein n=1 Tax=Tenacibaculum halocynthiae TaxID=1254437 RepID=UPI003D65CE6F